jgi:hypothetical protein
MKRVLYVLSEYPQISETYIASEIRAVKALGYELKITATSPANRPYKECEPFEIIAPKDQTRWMEVVAEFQPDIVHCHYIFWAPLCAALSQAAGAVFTVRTHSFDILDGRLPSYRTVPMAVNSPLCRGVLAFPCGVPLLTQVGIDPGKVHPCWPVVDLARFRDRGPNGDSVMNVGATLPKKNMEDFVQLAKNCPDQTFNLYAMGYGVADIAKANAAMGSPVNIVSEIEPALMPPEYKKHRWLVYTASHEMKTVGWPMAVAEAQASGVGVAMQNVRPDLAEYVGPGYLFDTVDDARRIISQPFPDEMREAAFAHAEKSDVAQHIGVLTGLWEKAV